MECCCYGLPHKIYIKKGDSTITVKTGENQLDSLFACFACHLFQMMPTLSQISKHYFITYITLFGTTTVV